MTAPEAGEMHVLHEGEPVQVHLVARDHEGRPEDRARGAWTRTEMLLLASTNWPMSP